MTRWSSVWCGVCALRTSLRSQPPSCGACPRPACCAGTPSGHVYPRLVNLPTYPLLCLGAQDAADRARRALAAPGSGTVAAGQQSDHLLMVAAVDGWLAARREGGPQGGWAMVGRAAQQALLPARRCWGGIALLGTGAGPIEEGRGLEASQRGERTWEAAAGHLGSGRRRHPPAFTSPNPPAPAPCCRRRAAVQPQALPFGGHT